MDQAGDGVLVLGLHGHHIAVRPDGDDGLLQILGLVGGDEPLQDIPDLRLGGPHVSADGGQLRAGGVGDLVLPQDGVGDAVLQKAVGGERLEQVGDGALLLAGAIVPGGAGRPQHGGHVGELPGGQAAPHVRPLEGCGHGLYPGETGAAPQYEHLHGGGRLVLGPLDVVNIRHRAECKGFFLALLRHGAARQHGQYLGQFKDLNGLF